MTDIASAPGGRAVAFGRPPGAVRATRSKHIQEVLLAGLSVCAISLCSAMPTLAQTWTGAASDDWTDGLNWSGGAAPGGATGVTINVPGTVVLGANGPATGATNGLIFNSTIGSLTIQNGSTLNTAGAVSVSATAGRVNTITVAGSTWDIGGNLGLGTNGRATLDITNGGVVHVAGATRLGQVAGSGALNITSHGVLETSLLTRGAAGAAQVTFDNGTLRALASDPLFINNLTVSELIIASGGLTIDTNAHAIGAPGFSGSGSLITTGTGTLTLSDVSTFTGDTVVGTGSTLALTGAGALASNRLVADGTFDVSAMAAAGFAVQRLEGVGTVALGAKTLAADQIAPGGGAFGTLTIDGNYAGTGNLLEIQTTLAGDGALTDRLVITGNSSGTTNVAVSKLAGTAAATTNGIQIVEVGGTSAGTFALLGDMVINGEQAIVSGAYLYGLYQGTPTSADGHWYLRNLVNPTAPDTPIFQPAAPVIEAYVAAALQTFNAMESMQQRLGNRLWLQGGNGASGIWGRIEGGHSVNAPESSTTATSYKVNTVQLQAGLDGVIQQSDAGTIIGGATLQIGSISADIGSASGTGTLSGAAYGLGAGLTWFAENGLYLDAQGRLTWFDTSLHSNTLNRSIVSGNAGFGYALSLEAGQQFAIDDNWSVTPQAQLSYSHVGFTDFVDPFGSTVSLDQGDSLVGRIGVSADYEGEWLDTAGQTGSTHLYGIANLSYELLDGTSTSIGSSSVSSKNDPLWGGLGLGGSLNWADDRFSLFGEVGLNSSLNNFGKSYSLGVTAGLKAKF